MRETHQWGYSICHKIFCKSAYHTSVGSVCGRMERSGGDMLNAVFFFARSFTHKTWATELREAQTV